MSKKKKKKFRAELAQTLNKLQQEKTQEIKSSSVSANTSHAETKTMEKDTEIDEDKVLAKTVGHEIKKIILAMGVCMVLLVGIWIMEMKTPYVNNFSNWLTATLHIESN